MQRQATFRRVEVSESTSFDSWGNFCHLSPSHKSEYKHLNAFAKKQNKNAVVPLTIRLLSNTFPPRDPHEP